MVVDDGVQSAAQDFLREGEIAMLRAKRAGADRIEIFTASMRGEDENRLPLESDLRKALEKRQLLGFAADLISKGCECLSLQPRTVYKTYYYTTIVSFRLLILNDTWRLKESADLLTFLHCRLLRRPMARRLFAAQLLKSEVRVRHTF